eukprot:5671862-Lingulodinium_polyedra.AAC.1
MVVPMLKTDGGVTYPWLFKEAPCPALENLKCPMGGTVVYTARPKANAKAKAKPKGQGRGTKRSLEADTETEEAPRTSSR